VVPAQVRVAPPGVSMGTFRPPLRLIDARSGAQEAQPGDRQTVAMLRRSQRRWEIYVECGRPRPMGPSEVDADRWPPRGVEAITIVIGDPMAPTAVLCVPEEGAWWTPVGVPSGLEVHRVSDGPIWRCRIVLPPTWLPELPDEPLLLGMARTHGDHDGIECAGLPRPPWIERPAPIAFDVSRWDDQ